MPDTKITALAAITTVDPAADVLPIVDISDTSMAASGTTKKITSNQILGAGGTATLASATISGDLTVDTSTLKVDSANNRVGIGTASPANQLSVRNEGASGIAVIDVRGGSAGAGAVQISGNATTLGTTSFDLLQNSSGAFVNQRDANPLSMFVNGSERYAISSSGVATWSNVDGVAGTAMTLNSTGLGVGVTPAGTGGCLQLKSGITFPATQVASSDANTLDDYEEGSWTPVVADAPTGGNTGTCTINSAKYTKIGRVVSVECDISGVTTTGMTAGNGFNIRGLPFVPVNGANGNFYTYRVGRNASTVSSSVYAPGGVTALQFYLYTASSGTADLRILVSDIVSTTSQIIVSVTYFV